MKEPVELQRVQPEAGMTGHLVGFNECESITLCNNGRGPYGFYDVIEIVHKDKPKVCFPAHSCFSWTLKN